LLARQQQLNFTPGEKHLYSSGFYILLAKVIERITGTTSTCQLNLRFHVRT
jgi:CubicO group peptidase (beta-lactamase class C family)